MTKKKFLSDLKSQLYFNFSPSEIKNIVSEYEGYFSKGVKEGKSEGELVAEFGGAELVAAELTSERRGGEIGIKMARLRILILTVIAAIVFTVSTNLIFFSASTMVFYDSGNIWGDIVFLLVLPCFAAFFLGGKNLFHKGHMREKGVRWLYLGNVAAHLLFILPCITILLKIFDTIETETQIPGFIRLFGVNEVAKLGLFTRISFLLIGVTLLILFVYSAIFSIRNSSLGIPLLFLNSSGLLGVFRFLTMLSTLSDPNMLSDMLWRIMASVIAGGVITVIAFAVVSIIERRGANDSST